MASLRKCSLVVGISFYLLSSPYIKHTYFQPAQNISLYYYSSSIQPFLTHTSAMLTTPLFILSTSFVPLTFASPTVPQRDVRCVHLPGAQPFSASTDDCTNLLRIMSREGSFHESTTYTAGHVIHRHHASCDFRLRKRSSPPGGSEELRLIEYFPAFQHISDQCLGTPTTWMVESRTWESIFMRVWVATVCLWGDEE